MLRAFVTVVECLNVFKRAVLEFFSRSIVFSYKTVQFLELIKGFLNTAVITIAFAAHTS